MNFLEKIFLNTYGLVQTFIGLMAVTNFNLLMIEKKLLPTKKYILEILLET